LHPRVLNVAALLTLTAVPACSGSEPASLRQRVLGGDPTAEQHAAVVLVTTELGRVGGTDIEQRGTGTLIAPNLIVTALHVVASWGGGDGFVCDADGNDISGGTAGRLGPSVNPRRIKIFTGPEPDRTPAARGARVISTESDTICKNDLAFVILDRDVEIAPARLRREQSAVLGEVMTVVGYGEHDEGTFPLRAARTVEVSAVGQWIRTFTVTSGPCPGDSGGPAFARDGSVAGVFSTVSADCRSRHASAKYTDLAHFSALAEAAFQAAGSGQPWPAEGGGSGLDTGGAGPFGGLAAAGGAEPDSEMSARQSSGCALMPARSDASHAPWLLMLVLVMTKKWAHVRASGRHGRSQLAG
jgi:hypothetical protein